jgi:hypothetical protein
MLRAYLCLPEDDDPGEGDRLVAIRRNAVITTTL